MKPFNIGMWVKSNLLFFVVVVVFQVWTNNKIMYFNKPDQSPPIPKINTEVDDRRSICAWGSVSQFTHSECVTN